jgi:hypothetical protein
MEPDQQSYERARARVQALKGFYIHASAFILVNTGLFVIDVLTGGVWWFYQQNVTATSTGLHLVSGRPKRPWVRGRSALREARSSVVRVRTSFLSLSTLLTQGVRRTITVVKVVGTPLQ